MYVKIGLSIIVSYIVLTFTFQTPASIGSAELIFLSFKEVITGLGLGLIAQLFFSIFASAGSIIDMDLGLSMSSRFMILKLATGYGNIKIYDIFCISYLYIDGHHYLMESYNK